MLKFIFKIHTPANYFFYFCITILCWNFLSNTAEAKMRSNNKIRAGVPPYEIVKQILAQNSKEIKTKDYGQESSYTPYFTWLTDSDARISPNLIIDNKTIIYSVRNLGNQVELATGAIDYGVRHLLTPVLLITSSSENTAVKFFMEGYGKLAPAIRRDLDHLHLALSGDNKKNSFQERLITNIESNVDYQVGLAMARYQDRINSGRLVVIGSIIDFSNVYKHGAGRMIIINVNGFKDSAKLNSQQILKSLSNAVKKTNVGRTRPKPPPNSTKKGTK